MSAWVVDEPLSPPYWLESSLLNIRSSIHPPTIRSSDFDKTAVNEMGVRSLLITRGRLAFAIGITLADFQIVGMIPSRMDALNIVHT